MEKNTRNRILQGAIVVLAIAFIIGLALYVFTWGQRDVAVNEFHETAGEMQKAIDANSKDATTDTLNYDAYKVTLNHELRLLTGDEQIVHINVGFGSLDRGLKYINDTYGHLNGRPAIQDFAALLKEVFPAEDGFTICHRGGSSFLVFGKGEFDEETLLGYYDTLRARWHDTPYQVADGSGTVEGMALYYCAAVAPSCGTTFQELREHLVYKKLALRDITNCGYVIVTSPDHYISSEEIDESLYRED